MSTIAENILKTLKSWLASSDVPTTVTPTQLVMKSDDTGKEYLVHPETEVAMIVDWDDKTSGFQQSTNLGNDILKNLASTAAMTAVTALTTDSWFGKLLKFVLDASGVKYSLEQNGYICLGSFFGGLIIQWIYRDVSSGQTYTLPHTFKSQTFVCAAFDSGQGPRTFGTVATIATYTPFIANQPSGSLQAVFIGR